ncbi:hypothetical protein L484_017357 [Morus notabilis]|uniref:Uncharacterized protein n=1 Tax=Morus notabilis TaxID=981085 RepID=W9RGI3_9ROSA|nr:hypothetical protein L484_017357 [Morus notabilis]
MNKSQGSRLEFWFSDLSHCGLLDGGGGKMRGVSIWVDRKLKEAWKPRDWVVLTGSFAGGWVRAHRVFFRMVVVFFWLWQHLLPATMAMAHATHVLLLGGVVSTPYGSLEANSLFFRVPSLAALCLRCSAYIGMWSVVFPTSGFVILSHLFELFTDYGVMMSD